MNYPLMTKGETKEDKENMKLILWFEFKERENIATNMQYYFHYLQTRNGL